MSAWPWFRKDSHPAPPPPAPPPTRTTCKDTHVNGRRQRRQRPSVQLTTADRMTGVLANTTTAGLSSQEHTIRLVFATRNVTFIRRKI